MYQCIYTTCGFDSLLKRIAFWNDTLRLFKMLFNRYPNKLSNFSKKYKNKVKTDWSLLVMLIVYD